MLGYIASVKAAPRIAGSTMLRCRFLSTSGHKKSRLITYLTDVEGDAAYLRRYVENSRVLKFQADREAMDFSEDTAMLIYGGDVWDKGGNDLWVIRQLLQLKHRYPDRVYFILGNRDINKMRIWQEIMSVRHDGVWWSKLKPDVTWTQSQRLQWMLAHTMGSPKAFEFRRNELGGDATDEQVTQSYLDSCHPKTGEMGQYLSQAQLVLKIGPLLILHGALPWMVNDTASPDYELSTPWQKAPPIRKDLSVDEWMSSLNRFANSEIEQWSKSVEDNTRSDSVWSTVGGFDYWPDEASPYRYSGLLQYGMGWLPDLRRRIPTIVYSSWMQDGMPRKFFDLAKNQFSRHTTRFMQEAGVRVILAGHQPQGDAPTPIRLDENKLIMCCDTSYAGDVDWEGASVTTPLGGRGPVAVCEVLIELDDEPNGNLVKMIAHGVLSNGREFESTNLLDDMGTGVLASDKDDNSPWWIKLNLTDGSQLQSTAKGYHVVNAIQTA